MDPEWPDHPLPEPVERWKVKPPPRLSDLNDLEKDQLSEQELLEALSEEDEDASFLLQYRELQGDLEKQRLELLAEASSQSSTPESGKPSPAPRSTSSSPSDSSETTPTEIPSSAPSNSLE